MVNKKPNFNHGDLVELCVVNRNITQDGFGTVGMHTSQNHAILFEFIDMQTYPSCNDFSGRSAIVKEGTRGIIIRMVGRPERIIESSGWHQYDIYEVLFNGCAYQLFDYNLSLATSEDDIKSL